MLHFDDIVFGPIRSRRLGSSLGINILPSKGKYCNFDCVYCECGWNKDGVAERVFPTVEQFREAIKSKMEKISAEGIPVDSITFSGNGEPTMHPDFPQIIDITLEMREEYCPDAKVSVLSNAHIVGKEEVLKALMKVDNPIMKIDAGSNDLVGKINRPSGSYNLSRVVDWLERFEGNFILQTMFLKSDEFSTTSAEALDEWVNIVRRLRPREIMVYTIDRETPDKSLKKYTVEEMTDFVRPLIKDGFKIQIKG